MERRETDELWTLPLENFTRVRDELAKKAKESGDAEGAKEIKALRKPSVAAWAVNQLARRRAEDIRRLLGLGDVMRKAQRDVLKGGGREALRTATSERRRLVDQLVEDAEAVLTQAGYSSTRTVLDRVSQTLLAATSDEDTGALVASGTVQKDAVPPSGLDDLSAWLPAGAGAGSSKPKKSKSPSKPSAGGRSKRADELTKRLEAKASEAETKAAEARSEAERLAREAARAARAAEREERLAAQARERADRARAEADQE